MVFAWPCIISSYTYDPTVRYHGHLLISCIIAKFAINRKIVLQVKFIRSFFGNLSWTKINFFCNFEGFGRFIKSAWKRRKITCATSFIDFDTNYTSSYSGRWSLAISTDYEKTFDRWITQFTAIGAFAVSAGFVKKSSIFSFRS